MLFKTLNTFNYLQLIYLIIHNSSLLRLNNTQLRSLYYNKVCTNNNEHMHMHIYIYIYIYILRDILY